MSWPSVQPASSRRSRSRSPRSFLPRPPYPEPSYTEGYREFDSDRDRWAYERDYGRRGRSRSPPFDENSRKRRRSPSPFERDRYEPRPRYNDDYDVHPRYGYSPPRRGGQYSRRPPPDPHTLDYPASLKQFADWFRFFYPQQAAEEDSADKAAEQEAGDGSKPRNGIRSRWEKYKKEFSAQQLQTMFDHHKKSPWFWEKYDPTPDFQKLRTRVRKEGWKGRVHAFLHDLESGKFDPEVNETEPEQPPSPTKENATNGDISVMDTGEDNKANPDEDIQFNMDGDEEEPTRAETNGKSNEPKRGNRGEEVSVPTEGNQVMIRTIPPDIGRLKLEESCKVIPGFIYLALGDPLQKRNYYRAGWIRFTDDADMTAVMSELQDRKIEGFKLHVTHNTKPFVNKIRYAPEVASKPERLEKDLANAKTLAVLLEEEAANLRKMKISADEPAKAEGEDAPMEVTAEGEEEEEPPERGIDAVERRIEKVMADLRDQGVVDPSDEVAYENKKTEVSLDMYIDYLRAAYHCCYYCCVVTDHLEELQRKCIKHVRKPYKAAEESKPESEKVMKDEEGEEKPAEKEKDNKKGGTGEWKRNQTDERWLEWLDSKIALLINRDGVDPRDYGGKSYDEELSKVLEPHIKQEDEGKFRCRVQNCQKLFKAASFVEKHIANKHPELTKPLDDLQYFNNFALDPHRIQPFAHVPPPVGNSTQAPPQAYGLQGPVLGSDFARYGPYPPSGAYPPGYPPQPGYWGGDGFPGGGRGYYYDTPYGGAPMVLPPSRRDESNPRRLSDRISGFAPGTDLAAAAGLPPKPPPPSLDAALSTGNSGGGGKRRGGNGQASGGPPPPPPPDAKEDPRAAAGRKISYHDMDLVAEGDVELTY